MHGTAATGSPESIRSWSSLAAGHPELVSEVAVSVRPPDFDGGDACTVARALVRGEHTASATPTYALSGPVSGGLWFANESGQLLDATGAVLPATSCYTAVGPSSLGALPVSVRPAMANATSLFLAHVSLEVVVPTDAVKVGAWLAVPGCPLDNCRPANGAFQFELLTAPDPEVVPGWSTVDTAYPVVGTLPRPHQPILPRSCRDPRWLRRTAYDAGEIDGSGAPSDPAAQEACFLDAVNNWPAP